MDVKKILDLALIAIEGKLPANFAQENMSMDDVENALREELKSFEDYKYFRANKIAFFELIEAIANIVFPRTVLQQFAGFAEVQQVEFGKKITFRIRTGRTRGKRFVTTASSFGVYKTFTLDSRDVVMNPQVWAGAARLEIQDFLLRRISMTELMDILIESITEKVYEEIQFALQEALNAPERPAVNRADTATFDSDALDMLINTVSAYGDTVTIYCTRAFAQSLYNRPGWAGNANPQTSLKDYDDVREMGFVGRYKGTNIVIMPQSFRDESNTETLVNDAFAYIMPSSIDAPVKIAFEGTPIVSEREDVAMSMEISIQQRFDIVILTHNNWAIYHNQELEV